MKKKLSVLLILVLVLSTGSLSFASDYMVKDGDTLAKIAAMYNTTVNDLVKMNGIKDPNMIIVGDMLKIDGMADEFTTRDLNDQMVMAALWYQQAAEFRALSYQTFELAKMLVEKDLMDTTVTMPRAIVVDLDETILDNSAYEAWLVDKDFGYSSSTWNPWIQAGIAPATPGAVEFLNFCKDNNVEVFYVSNRKVLDDNSGYTGTVKNLNALGLPYVDAEHVLLRTGSSDKTERRSMAEASNHVVLYMGDNLNDFLQDFAGKSVMERFALTDAHKADFGEKFIVMPNPMYGEWEGAVYGYNWGSTSEEKSDMRKDMLKTWNYAQ
jgi:5'-nucleotidase (lipoprotein e(P4) family)